MVRKIENKIGIDEFVEAQVWTSFDDDWRRLGPLLHGKGALTLQDIGESYLTAAEQNRVASVTPAQEDHALDYIIRLIDRIGVEAPRGKLGEAYGLCHNLPGGAAWRFFQEMGRTGADLGDQYRYDPDSYEPSKLREMLIAAKARRQGRTRNANLDFTIARLAQLWGDATGAKPTFSSARKLEEHGPARSAFGQFVHAVFDALGSKVGETAIATSIRRVLRAMNARATGTIVAN